MPDYTALHQAVISGKVAQVKELTQAALSAGANPQEVLDQGLIPAMDSVGQKFSCHEFYIPEMLIAARAMQAGIALLKPGLAAQGGKPRGKVVIGTVKGDIHDIGKNLVTMMMTGAGYEVVDLGTDVPQEKFVEAVSQVHPDLVGLSALLTTTMLEMKGIIQTIRDAFPNPPKILVGGAPVTQKFADEIGADGYGEDAVRAVEVADRLISPGC